jgi:hypothetical protein
MLMSLLTRASNLNCIAANPSVVNSFLRISWRTCSELDAKVILGLRRLTVHLISGDCPRKVVGGDQVEINDGGGPETLMKLVIDWGLLSPGVPIERFQRLFEVSTFYLKASHLTIF